jgi:hypothetical protein
VISRNIIKTIIFQLFQPDFLINLDTYGGDDGVMKLHIYFGYALLGLTITQILLGTISYFSIYRNEKVVSSSVHNFKIIHKVRNIHPYSNIILDYWNF